jgi:hypothetical protein
MTRSSKPGGFRVLAALLAGVSFLLGSCSEPPLASKESPPPAEPLTPQPANPNLPLASRDFLVGIAGLIAPHYPHSTADDYRVFLAQAPATGELLGVYLDWNAPDLIESIGFVDQYVEGMDPVVALGFDIGQVSDDYFTRHLPAIRDAVRSVLLNYQLDYFAFGVEVNRLIPEISQAAFLDFVAAYREVYGLVKELSPQTKVFTIFQLEYLKGAATLSGREFDPQWEILELFEGKLDLVGLTVYPFLEFTTVDDIPQDYYAEIPRRIDLPLAITEMAWPSEDVSIVEGSQQAQVEFLFGILEGTRDWDLEFMLYSFLYEPQGVDLFESAALRESSGQAKQIYDYWEALAGLPKE